MRTVAIATLGISMPLAIAYSGFDGKPAGISFVLITAIAFVCLLATFERVRRPARAVVEFFRRPLQQAFLASSSAVACGVASLMVWSTNKPVRFLLLALAVISVNWWLHLLMRTATGQVLVRKEEKARGDRKKIAELEAANSTLVERLAALQDSSNHLTHAVEENERIRAVVRHVMNVLLGLEEAKQGRGGVNELGVDTWIEHRCLLATRDVLEELAGRPDGFRIELGIVRTGNGVNRVEMSAGDYLSGLRAKGGCPEFGSIAELVDRKARQGGFDDSFALEFQFREEPHHMIALANGRLDDTDRQLLSLVAVMFIVLKVALGGS